MIVTRQRRKRFSWRGLALPLVAIALVAIALWWGPSRNVIANGPAAPLWRAVGSALGPVTAPFNLAAQKQLLDQRTKQLSQLQQQVSRLQQQNQAKDKQLNDTQAQLAQAQTQTPPPAPGRSTATGVTAGASPGVTTGDLSADATPDMRRTAAYWANMEPENAARVVQRLPVLYVARVFALMSPDAASAIMDALPPKYAAQLTQEHPQLGR